MEIGFANQISRNCYRKLHLFGTSFAEAACADQSVMDAFLEWYVCSSAGPVMNCADNGISSYKELKSMSRGEIRTRLLKKIGSTSDIPRLGDDPKFVAVDDAEVVGDSIAGAVPVLGNRVFQEFQNCSLELPECFVVPVVGGVLVHESPTLFDRIEMGTIWRDEVQHGFSVLLF